MDYWAIRLSKAGYGDVNTIKMYDAETFLNLIHYETFMVEYERQVRDLNTADFR